MSWKPGLIVVATIVASMLMLLSPLASAQSTPQVANLWIDTNGGSCTRLATPGAYVDGQACSSMQAAQSAAQAGDNVVIKNGTYASQSLSSGQKTSAVNYIAETSGQVLVGGLSVSIDKVHIKGVIASGTGEGRGTLDIQATSSNTPWTDVVIDGFQGKSAFIAAAGVTFQNGEIGNASACLNPSTEDAFRFWSWGIGNAISPDNDKLLNSKIHDWTANPDGVCTGTSAYGIHPDGFQAYSGGTNITIRGNLFWNNASSNMQVGGNTMGAWTIENNYFGATQCCNNLSIGQGNCASVIIQNNVIVGNADNNGSCTGSPAQRSNIFTSAVASCSNGGSFSGDHNIFPVSGGTTCGTTAKRCSPSFVHGLPPGWGGAPWTPELNSSDTCAKDAGNASVYPVTDMYGTVRPQGSAPDAGAYEISSSTANVSAPTNLQSIVH